MVDNARLSKAEFVRAIEERDARNIYKAQLLILTKNTYIKKDKKDNTLRLSKRRKGGVTERTGTLRNSLENPNFFIKSQGSEFILQLNYPLYMRFLDMKTKSNLQIYNRQIWGILYNNTIPDIKFGYEHEIRSDVGDMLNEAFLNK